MSVVPAPSKATLPLLTHDKQRRLRPLAVAAVVFAAVFTGANTNFQVIVLAPAPGTAGDPVLKSLTFLSLYVALATCFKFIEVKLLGGWIEGRLDLEKKRPIVFADAFGPKVRKPALRGGLYAAIYGVLLVTLVPILASSTLSTAKTLVLVVLPFFEMKAGIMSHKTTSMFKLAVSISITITGALLVIFASGIHGLGGLTSTVVFLVLITVGNGFLAQAECNEYKGASNSEVAASVYTLARYLAFTAFCIVGMLVWMIVRQDPGVALAVAESCLNRWYWLVPIALLTGLADLFRICAKPVISATYMYVIMSVSVGVAAVTQMIAKQLDPKLFAFVHGGWEYLAFCLLGAGVIAFGARAFPHPKAHPKE
jgi:hypothetical protein